MNPRDIDEHFSGNYLDEATILKLARQPNSSSLMAGELIDKLTILEIKEKRMTVIAFGHNLKKLSKNHRLKVALHLINDARPISDLLLPEQPCTRVPWAIIPIQ